MRKLLKYFQEKRMNILIMIGVMAFIIFIIHFINYMLSVQNSNSQITNTQGTLEVQDITKPTETIIDGSNISIEIATNNSEIIKEFVEYCNQKQYENAYELLSDECKKIIYQNNIQYFINNYAQLIFNTERTYELKAWISSHYGYTYQIYYYEGNPLQTGGISSGNNYMDYITVVTQDNEPKISINKFIAEEDLNDTAENEFIKVNLISKIIYADYEIYEINVMNKTENTILLNDGQHNSNIYITDNDNIKYNSCINEIPINLLVIQENYQRTFNVKFNRNYQGISDTSELQMNNIILDYEEYLNNSGDENLQTTSIKINI